MKCNLCGSTGIRLWCYGPNEEKKLCRECVRLMIVARCGVTLLGRAVDNMAGMIDDEQQRQIFKRLGWNYG